MSRFEAPGRELPLEVGDVAPDWQLRRTFDDTVSLASLCDGGPVVLAFYVFDFGVV